MPRLENWSVTFRPSSSNPYAAPETLPPVLHGEVYNHPRFEDGTPIITSRIESMSAINRTATTFSGSNYELGDPSEQFVEWLEQNGKRLEDYEC